MKSVLKSYGLILSLTLITVTSCGDQRNKKAPGGLELGQVEAAFIRTAAEFNLPVRLLLAVALMESNLNPERSSAQYLNEDYSLGLSLGETAFGLTYSNLGLPDEPISRTLDAQLQAYGRLIRATIDQENLSLNAAATSIEAKFDWIWLLARLHRGGLESRRNIQVVFALELMSFLNLGATWQSLETGEVIELTKENPPYRPTEFPPQLRNNLKLFTATSDIFNAQYFELTYQKPADRRNQPRRLQVIHCPFSLSACLELQNPLEETDGIRLNAHYLIPQDDLVVNKPLQVAQHSQVVLLTNNQGIPESIQDSLVIMLTGQSGRYVEGRRQKARPDWFTKWQLKQMGSIVRNLCPLLAQDNDSIKIETCIDPSKEGGVFFRHQGVSDEFKWGDTPDYDESIFWPHIAKPDALEGGINMQLASPNATYRATDEIQLRVNTTNEAAKIVLEQAQRCPNQKLVWTVLQNRRIRATRTSNFQFTLFDPGPNGNGEHYLRAMVYNIRGELLGWAIQNIVLTDYPKDNPGPGAEVKQCQRNGT
jgi:hypothetical protein